VPDFEGMDIRRAFLDANGVSRSGRLDIGPFLLHNADFRSARIINANFNETHFLGSDFRMAQLGGSAFDEVHLASCDLRGADLAHIDWGGSSVQDADVTTFVDTSGEIIRTDLSRAGLTRNELDSMKGDSETIIPDHLERAEYWPEFEFEEREQQATSSPPATTEGGSHDLTQRIAVLLRNARGAALTAEAVAFHIGVEVDLIRQSKNEIGPEVELLDELVLTLGAIKEETDSPNPSKQDLLTKLNALEEQVEALQNALEAKPGAFSEAFRKEAGKSSGKAVVAGPLGLICGGLVYLLGPTAQQTVAGFAAAAAAAGVAALK
ncbi:MAG: pentapeptide repeat-containing protein, partial [Pseudomonadota bacterium]